MPFEIQYNWIKAAHLICVIAWMAGMLYLPRLFVYHTNADPGSATDTMLKAMERRLLRYIINPAMIATWGFGVWMIALYPAFLQQGFMQVKIAMLVGMQIVHTMLARYRRAFANDQNIHTAQFYRILNEVPTVLMIIIVIMIIVRPEFQFPALLQRLGG